MAMHKNVQLHMVGLFFVVLLFCCLRQTALAAGKPAVLKAAGCKTEYYLVQDLARGFSASVDGVVLPQKTGNKVAIKLLAAEQIDFAFTCKPQAQLVEKFKVPSQTAGYWESRIIANDPIVAIVHRENKVISLSIEQLGAIFSGRIINWKELGGIDHTIQVAYLNKTVESGVLTLFRELVRDAAGKTKKIKLREDAFQASGPKQLGAYVSQNQGGISFMALSSYRRRYGSLVNINAVPPNRETIKDGSYPLTVTYHIIYDSRKKQKLLPFLDYINSAEGASIIDQGFISRKVK